MKVDPTPVHRERKERTSVHVKAEPNALATTIDLVSSDEDVPHNESSIDTSQKRAMVAPAGLPDKERTEARLATSQMRTMVPPTGLPDKERTEARLAASQMRTMIAPAVQ